MRGAIGMDVRSEAAQPQPSGVPRHLGVALMRNAGMNLCAQLLVITVGFFSIPVIVAHLGVERFGILSILWTSLTFFTVLDLGVGHATTKFVAEALGKGSPDLPSLVWSSLATQLALGAAAGISLAAVAPLLVERVLRVPPPIVREVRTAFLVVAAMVPIMLIGAALKGVLEGAQRYDFVNLVKVPVAAGWFVLPALGGSLGCRLNEILIAVAVLNAAGVIACLLLASSLFPVLPSVWAANLPTVRLLMGYGGWMALAQAVWSFMLQVDRLLVASILGIAQLAFYAAPLELVGRLWIVPGSLIVLLPAFSWLGCSRERELRELSARALKFLLISVGPIAAILVAFADDILGLWLGEAFRHRSVVVLQVLAVGMLLSCLGAVPDLLLKGLGRPDVVAKIHLALLAPYAAVSLWLIARAGIAGAAVAWSLRAAVGTGLLLRAASMHTPALRSILLDRAMWIALAAVGALGICLWAGSAAGGWAQVALVTPLILAFGVVSWWYVLDATDRNQVRAAMLPGRKRR